MNIVPKIKSFKINKNIVQIGLTPGTPVQLSVSINSKINPPMDKSKDNSALLQLILKVASENEKDFIVDMSTETVFEFNQAPDDYTNEVERLCSLSALEKVSEALDSILQIMNHPTLNLYSKLPNSNTIEEL